MSTSLIAELPRVKQAFYAIAASALLLSAFFCAMFVFVLYGDRGKPQFPYELVISLAGTIYFGALCVYTLKGAKGVLDESRLPQTLGSLARAVFGMFIPLVALGAWLIWSTFQPAY